MIKMFNNDQHDQTLSTKHNIITQWSNMIKHDQTISNMVKHDQNDQDLSKI